MGAAYRRSEIKIKTGEAGDMITKLGIKNFKSIKSLELDCKRVNVFIGEPNTGKSNILEALGLLSWCGHDLKRSKRAGGYDPSGNLLEYSPPTLNNASGVYEKRSYDDIPVNSGLSTFVRFENVQNLFFDNKISEPIEICVGKKPNTCIELTVSRSNLKITSRQPQGKKVHDVGTYDLKGNIAGERTTQPDLQSIKFFRFKDLVDFPDPNPQSLQPPYGENLFSVVYNNPKLLETMKNFFADSKFEFVIKPNEQKFEFQHKEKDVVYTFPYIVGSDTLRHIAYYAIAMESNAKSTLVFEEPESQAFPYYIKWFGERIALYSDNQFFIATHNPYLLTAIVEKTPFSALNVCITYMKDYQTKIVTLKEEQISEFMEFDPFLNARSFIPEGVGGE